LFSASLELIVAISFFNSSILESKSKILLSSSLYFDKFSLIVSCGVVAYVGIVIIEDSNIVIAKTQDVAFLNRKIHLHDKI